MKLTDLSIGIRTPKFYASRGIVLLAILVPVAVVAFIIYIHLSQQQLTNTHLNQAKDVSLSTPTVASDGTQTSQATNDAAISGNQSTSSSANSSSNNSTTVDVNGKTVVVPANSSYSQTTSSDGSTSSVNVNSSESSNNSGNGATNTSSTNATTVDTR